jgi:hypothetical protein
LVDRKSACFVFSAPPKKSKNGCILLKSSQVITNVEMTSWTNEEGRGEEK